jgi:CHAT domain-containing protein/tetratricopeptide (TPR) repeat protein
MGAAMPMLREKLGVRIAALLLAGAILSARPALAESNTELDALNKQVHQLYQAGKYQEAIPVAKRQVEVAENSLSANHPNTALALNNLAEVLRLTGQFDEAEPLFRRALAINEKALGPEHPNLVAGLHSLAQLLQAANRLVEAEALHRRALAIHEMTVGPDHATLAGSLDNLAVVIQLSNRHQEAEGLYRRALAIKERSFGAHHIAVADTLIGLAYVLAATSRPMDAEALLRRALIIQDAALGSDHPIVATTLSSLARILAALNRSTEAEQLYRRAVTINQKQFGLEDASEQTINNLNGLAFTLQTSGQFTEAEAIYRRVLAISEKRYGAHHPKVADALSSLSSLLGTTNRHIEAEAPLRRALAIRERDAARDPIAVTRTLGDLADVLKNTNRYVGAEQLYRRALAIAEASSGPDHWLIGNTLISLASVLHDSNRLDEAEPIIQRLLALPDASYGPDHGFQATNLSRFAQLLFITNRLGEAEALHRRALALQERNSGPDHPYVAQALGDLAQLLVLTSSRFSEAEHLLRRALTIQETSLGPNHAYVANTLTNLAQLLQTTNRFNEAEPLHRRALAIRENTFGPDHMAVAVSLNSVAHILSETNRLSDAEPLIRRALAIQEQNNPDHWGIVVTLNNLAYLSSKADRPTEAELLFRRALVTGEKALGAEHWAIALLINNLAVLLQEASRFDEAEPLYRRALAISEKSLDPNHPNVARDVFGLAWLLHASGRLADAEPLYRRSLAIFERSLGPGHPSLAVPLTNLAGLFAERGDWAAAFALHARAKPILIGRAAVNVSDRAELAKTRLAGNAKAFRAHARATYHADADGATAREEGFEAAQWALHTSAADALAQMSVRFAKSSGRLAALVREHQDLMIRRRAEDKRLLEVVGKADVKATEAIRAGIVELDTKLDAIDKSLAKDFPEYAELSSPKPLLIGAVQTLLRPDEALVVFLDIPRFGKLPEETMAWAVTRTQVRWISIPQGTTALSNKVATLRCGLDRDGLWSWSGQRWVAKGERCKALKPDGLGFAEPLPFDLALARELHDELLKPFADLIKGKSLIIVPSGPLTSLPFQVLVVGSPGASDPIAAPPPGLAAGTADYRKAAWLALKQPITILPSVSSLQYLRKLGPSQAKEPYLAFGNPLLEGGPADRERARQAVAKQTCPQDLESIPQRVVGVAKGIPALSTIWRGSVDLEELRRQTPLPETADELCAVAKSLGVLAHEVEAVWLGARATETNLKTLSSEGKLARYRVLHFATHGLLASESETILKAKAEPALVLTPPKDGASAAELERDDGLLTASEVAQLELDADWVVLSACNTAAGEKGDAEALAGLARAYFYAKARALLVSHWAVDSNATVELIAKTVAAMQTDPRIGRAEALRRSMVSLISKGDAFAHPATWAPFVLVGEGQKSARAPTPAAKPKTLPPAAKNPMQPDWQTELLAR